MKTSTHLPVFLIACLCLVCGNFAFSQSVPVKRIALVIGIKAYENVQPLQNSRKDAYDMALVLKSKGFHVIELYDSRTKKELLDGIRKYSALLSGQESAVGMLFYSGHGMQVDGDNYLIPAGAELQIKADIDDQCVNVNYIMRALEETNNALNIFVLDACRNNPFRGFSRSGERGLNMVNAPKGSYIVYATKPGSVASDGTGSNGLFTSKLLKYINTPDLDIEHVFKHVAADVAAESGDAQRPWISSDFTGDFYFSTGAQPITIKREGVPTGSETTRVLVQNGDDAYSKSDYEHARGSYLQAFEQGDPLNAEVENKLGYMYAVGKGVDINYQEAFKWFQKSSDQGNAGSQNWLGSMFYKGQWVAKDYNQAFKWFQKSALQGNTNSQSWLGQLYHDGEGVAKDYPEAIKWFQKASDNGNAVAQNWLAFMYYEGKGVAQDYYEAFKWYKKSGEGGNSSSQSWAGQMCHDGRGTTKDFSEALKWFQKSADQGNSIAQNWLGSMYYNGEGVAVDFLEAYKWFKKSADQGEKGSQNWLGMLYYDGKGVAKDHYEAFKWYKKSAEQGNISSQDWTGYFYENGQGVEKDMDEAKRWYTKAADQGNDHAKGRLKALNR